MIRWLLCLPMRRGGVECMFDAIRSNILCFIMYIIMLICMCWKPYQWKNSIKVAFSGMKMEKILLKPTLIQILPRFTSFHTQSYIKRVLYSECLISFNNSLMITENAFINNWLIIYLFFISARTSFPNQIRLNNWKKIKS